MIYVCYHFFITELVDEIEVINQKYSKMQILQIIKKLGISSKAMK